MARKSAAKRAAVATHPLPLDFRGGVDERRRRGGVGIEARLPRRRQEASRIGANRKATMLRGSVPIDVNAVAASESMAFALATPLRVEDLVVAAIVEALGSRAPHDKRERVIRRTLAGLCARDFVVEIDGRIYNH